MSDVRSSSHPDETLLRAVQLLAANPEAAERALRDILKAHPDDLNAPVYLARALRAQGKSRRAIAVLEALRAAHPQYAVAHYELALVQADRSETVQAIAGVRAALSLDPKFPHGWLVLGDLLFKAGDETGADAAYLAHVAWSTDAPAIREAVTALNADPTAKPEDTARAEAVLRRHLRGLPNDVAALAVLGEVLARQNDLYEAAAVLEQCVARVPGFVVARFNYAATLSRLQRGPEALVQLNALLQKDPRNVRYRSVYGAVLAQVGETAQAIACFESLLADYPDDVDVWIGYGDALRTTGRSEDAAKAYRRCLALKPDHGGAYWSLANLKTVRAESGDIARLRAVLASTDLAQNDRVPTNFALGRALEDAGDYRRAFAAYAEGNALRFAELRYDAAAGPSYRRRVQASVTPDLFAPARGAPARDPIFIVGLPRSGSTLIEQILASHSRVEGTAELTDLHALVRRLDRNPQGPNASSYPEILPHLAPRDLAALGADYIASTRLHRKTAKQLFTDKMPGNFEHVGLIALILPNAKIIDARRHPMGCCVSNFRQLFPVGQPFAYDLAALGRYYDDYVQLMAYYDRVLPDRVHRVFHEDVVADPEREIRRLLDYCELEFEPACLRFYETKRPVHTISAEQVRRPIFADGVDHWKNFEPWLGPLKEALGPVLDAYPDVPRM